MLTIIFAQAVELVTATIILKFIAAILALLAAAIGLGLKLDALRKLMSRRRRANNLTKDGHRTKPHQDRRHRVRPAPAGRHRSTSPPGTPVSSPPTRHVAAEQRPQEELDKAA